MATNPYKSGPQAPTPSPKGKTQGGQPAGPTAQARTSKVATAHQGASAERDTV